MNHLIGVGLAQDAVRGVQVQELNDHTGLLCRLVGELVVGAEVYFTLDLPMYRRYVQLLDKPLVVIEAGASGAIEAMADRDKRGAVEVQPPKPPDQASA